VLENSPGVIDSPIREFGSGRMGIDHAIGRPSLTEYETCEIINGYTLVNAHPATGRRHQIRVHFYSIGRPVVGDVRYGNKSAQSKYPRLMLHSRTIALELPSSGNATFESPLPDSFTSVVDSIRAGAP